MKKIYLQVPQPCHEDWNKMIVVEKGRYCGSCCKEVIDFSGMTDDEIIRYLSTPRGGTCGRFSADQLTRAITEPAVTSNKRSWGLLFSFLVTLIGACKQKASETIGKIAVSSNVPAKSYSTTVQTGPTNAKAVVIKDEIMIVGELMLPPVEFKEVPLTPEQPQPVADLILHGQVTDSSLNPVPFASVHINEYNQSAIADSNGRYTTKLSASGDFRITASSVGYESQEIFIPFKTDTIERDIILRAKPNTLEEVAVVSSEYLKGKVMISCGFGSVRTEQSKNRVIDTVRNLFDPSPVRLFPNPAVKGSFVNVVLGKASDYQLVLGDNNGKLILQQAFRIAQKNQVYRLELPFTLSAGMYYVIITDKVSKKQFTEKLIIQ